LLVEIDALLGESGVALDQVTAFAVAIGPGAFTSLRIALATVKGLAFGTDLPVVGISTLACIAHGFTREPARLAGADTVLALLDARRGEVYSGAFRSSAGAGQAGSAASISVEAVLPAEELVRDAARGAALVGELPEEVEEAIAAAGRSDLLRPQPSEACSRALALAELGWAAVEAGEGRPARDWVPRYLRRPEAEEKRRASLDTPEKLA